MHFSCYLPLAQATSRELSERDGCSSSKKATQPIVSIGHEFQDCHHIYPSGLTKNNCTGATLMKGLANASLKHVNISQVKEIRVIHAERLHELAASCVPNCFTTA